LLVLPYIAKDFVLFYFLWSTYNIPDSNASEYLTIDTFKFDIGKYYIAKKAYSIPDSSVSE